MKKSNSLVLILVVAAVFFGIWQFLRGNNMEHIEDTNGPDDYSIAVITEEEILAEGVKHAKGGPNTSESHTSFGNFSVSNSTRYYSKKFSGIYELDNSYLFPGSDLNVMLYEFQVTSGNLQIFVVLDDVIVGTINPGDEMPFVLYDTAGGTYRLLLVGESAAFEFVSFDLEE